MVYLLQKALDKNAGLLLAYEKQVTIHGHQALARLFELFVSKRIKEQGADAGKFLLYYDVDRQMNSNPRKQAISNASVLNALLKIFHSLLKSWLMMKEFRCNLC